MANTRALGARARKSLGVQVSPCPPKLKSQLMLVFLIFWSGDLKAGNREGS